MKLPGRYACITFFLLLLCNTAAFARFSRQDLHGSRQHVQSILPYRQGELLVKYAGSTSLDTCAEDHAALRKASGAVLVRHLPVTGMELWHISSETTDIVVLARELTLNPAIAYAEPNYIYTADLLPDDPLFPLLWGLHNTGQTNAATPGIDIDAPQAWNLSTGSDIIIGVIDTGIDYTHPDIISNMWRNPGEIPDDGIDNDLNGYIDDIYGIDPHNNDTDPMDDEDHGTHCAGTIAAAGNNNRGIAGVCWQAKLMALKFLGSDGRGDSFDAITCIEYAIQHGARVLNNSWGGGGYSQALKEAIGIAGASNIVFCAAAGNGGLDGKGDNNDSTPHYPSSYTNENIIAVAATDWNDELTYFSNYGQESVDLAAPGWYIVSTVRDSSYEAWAGTSMATPHVAGSAALLLSFSPYMSVPDLKNALLEQVDPVPVLSNKVVSAGRLNIYTAFQSIYGVFFDHPTYFTRTTARLMLVNSNLAGQVSTDIELTSSDGDRESLLLLSRDTGGFAFTNSIRIVPGNPVVGNGVLEGVHGTVFDAVHPAMTITGRAAVSLALDISITTKPSLVTYAVSLARVAGINNGNVFVGMTVSNAATGEAHAFSATNAWQSPSVFLSGHTDVNTIWIFGTNAYGFADSVSVEIRRLGPAGVTNFVSPAGTHNWPFTSWDGAATSLYSAVLSADNGNHISVAEGVYTEPELIISRSLSLESISGPERTIIDTAHKDRCLTMLTGAWVSGFSFVNGSNRYGGGVYMYDGILSNCVVSGCSAYIDGGGVYLNALNTPGGAVLASTLTGNFAGNNGGGAYTLYGGRLENCAVTGNASVEEGGGVYCKHSGELERCIISGNYTAETGGGIYFDSYNISSRCVIVSSLVNNNAARKFAGGISCNYGGTVINCTITGNNADILAGGGVYCRRGGSIINSIIYDNTAALSPNWYTQDSGWTFTNCCTTPRPVGPGCITNDPACIQPEEGNYRLRNASVCINAGMNTPAAGSYDLDGTPRVKNTLIDIGAYEFEDGQLNCYFSANTTNVLPATTVTFSSETWGIDAKNPVYHWDFDYNGMFDATGTGLAHVSYSYDTEGTYSVTLNVTSPGGSTAEYIRINYITVIPEPAGSVICILGILSLIHLRRAG